MPGLRLQIFGQYQGLARNFCDRSQSVSPFWMVYSSGAPGTGDGICKSAGGCGRCGAFSGGPFGAGSAFCAVWAKSGSAIAAIPEKAALRNRAIVFVRIL